MSNDLFNLMWKNWNRPMKEVSGYKIIDREDGYLIVANALGIAKDDLRVELTRESLKIVGSTENEEINFTNSVNYQFNIAAIHSDIDRIEYELKDGLAYVNVITKEAEENKITIQYKE